MLQEFDLPRGVTVIGRSLDCHLTIEDPLVSRRHAQIVVTDNGAEVEDLGSRNGVKVNGAMIPGPTALRSGDRLRIGTQELIFSRVEDAGHAHSRTTGQLRLCANCRQPYPREMVSCPTCEATEQTEDETLTATGGESHRWTVQLFVEALERAVRLGRALDVERLLRRAAMQVEELSAAGRHVDADILGSLATHATAPSLATNDPAWVLWGLEIFGQTGRVPPASVVENLSEIATHHPGRLSAAIAKLVARLHASASAVSRSDVEALTIERLWRLGAKEAGPKDSALQAPEAAPPPSRR